MKATDFRPEHFEKGRSFKKSDFLAYIEASENLTKTLYTRYLPCIGAGLIFGFLFSRAVGGFVGNMLALVCIFAGLIVGGIFNAKAAKSVNEIAARLGISKEDVAVARQHVKNGTVAWSGGSQFTLEEEPPYRDEVTSRDEFTETVVDKAGTAPALSENPMRAVWAAGLFSAGWLLLVMFQVSFIRSLRFSTAAFICLSSAVLGVAVYLMSRSEQKWKIIGGGFGLLSALFFLFSEYVRYQASALLPGFHFLRFLRDPLFTRNFVKAILPVLLCLGAVLVFSVLYKKEDKKQVWKYGLIGGIVYFIIRLLFVQWRLLGNPVIQTNSIIMRERIMVELVPAIISLIIILLACIAMSFLCNMVNTQVKLYGIGLAWAYIALIGSILSIFLLLRIIFMDYRIAYGSGMYAYSIILGLSALIGYSLLLRKKRVGLYYILLGAGLIIIAELIYALFVGSVMYGGSDRILGTLLGGLNPLFAWLAVRAADRKFEKPIGFGESTVNNMNTDVASTPDHTHDGAVAWSGSEKNSLESTVESTVKDGTELFLEKDNMGTRQETMSQAIAYWMGERMGLSVKPPFTMFTMPSAEAAESALLELPFIHKAEDSGKLICDRLMTYGYYETTLNGQPTGQFEAMITGSDLTLDEFKIAEEAFKKYGGTLKNHDEPDASVVAENMEGDASLVKYSETVKGNDGISTYEVYNGPNKASAVAFLKTKQVTKRMYYIVVDTPEGSFGKDINGFYQE